MGNSSSSSKSLRRKVRGSYAISTVSIALVLFLLAGVGYLIWNLSHAANNLKEQMTLHVMLSDQAPEAAVEEIGHRLEQTEGIKEVQFISKEQAAAEFKEFAGVNFEEFLGHNPLPASYQVSLRASHSPKELVEGIATAVEEWQGVEEVVYQRAVVDNMERNIGKFRLILLLFGSALLVISLILLRNTIRMSVFSRRHLINTMKLVGASKRFIKRPFLVDALWQGVAAALLAMAMFWAMVVALSEGFPYIMLISGQSVWMVICGGLLVSGIALSVLFTNFSLGHFIRMNGTKIHIY